MALVIQEVARLFFVSAIQALLLVLVGAPSAYLCLLSILALTQREKKEFPVKRLRKIAVVVPAHNEALVIETTLRKLSMIEYPRDLYEIMVIADNCTDNTLEIARRSGAKTFRRDNPGQRGKGHALRWCFDQIVTIPPSHDAVVVIDADSTVSKNFLSVMNFYLEQGNHAIQSSDLPEVAGDGWIAGMTGLSFLLYNYVRPSGRTALGCSAGLKGNGMCLSTEALASSPWSSFSLAEDVEQGLELLLHDIPVRFAPEAKVFASMPQLSENAESQRVRWEMGRIPLIRKYGLRLLGAAFNRRSFRLFDAFVELVTPSFVYMMAVAVSMIFANTLFFLLGNSESSIYLGLWIAVLGLGFLHVTVGILAAHSDFVTLRSVLHVPKYLLWKLGLFLSARGTDRTKEWIRTTRESEVEVGSKDGSMDGGS